ncbi:FAD-binding oxidoreductase [Paenibacillus sp. CC-CFT747]|nr:FAD-binding oxidoreductase [Paenibacillus sp. CC-CFT747]
MQLYRDWTERIAGRSGLNPQYEAEGIVRIAYTEEDEAELRSRLPWIGDYSWLEADDLRRLEPGIGGEPRGGLFFSGDHRVHPVKLAEAMRAGLERLGCRVLENTPCWASSHRADGRPGCGLEKVFYMPIRLFWPAGLGGCCRRSSKSLSPCSR